MIEKLQWRSAEALISKPQKDRLAEDDEKRLELINLSGLSLDIVPDSTINLAAICKLDLSNNNLQSIPESVTARLVNVVALDVHSNQLKSLPNSIGGLSKLKLLNVSGNLLRSLPKSILNCRSLEELSANFNKLTALPEPIGFDLPNLKKLSVNSNQIMFLPHSTCHLTALRTLDVRLNCLRSLPEDLESLISLQILDASQNFHHLSKLPSSIGHIASLLELDVSYNKITNLPSSIGCSTKLRKLWVQGNPLVSPPMDVVQMGLHTVRMYLTAQQLNTVAPHRDPPRRKRSWFGQIKKHSSNLVRYQHLEAVASPRYSTMLSRPPHCLFPSPRNPFAKFF